MLAAAIAAPPNLAEAVQRAKQIAERLRELVAAAVSLHVGRGKAVADVGLIETLASVH